jgi:CRP-like cAMP-binding protein
MARLEAIAEWDVLFREGAPSQDLFLVQSGFFALDMFVPARGRITILTVGPGELLGWSALLGEGAMTATATAVENSQVIGLPGDKLRTLCNVDHEFGYSLMRHLAVALSQRLLATRLQLLDLFAPVNQQPGSQQPGAQQDVPFPTPVP